MKILVFGNSDSSGQFVEGRTWTELAEAMLIERDMPDAAVNTVRFSAEAPSAVAYVEKKVTNVEPDAVVLPIGSFAFTAGFVWVRVGSLFGERAGRWYRRVEEGFDSRTRKGGRPRRMLNAAGRRVTRTIIGTKPLSTREAVTRSYLEVLRALSRHENLPVVIITYPGAGAHARSAKAIAARRLFFAELRAAADGYRYQWVDGPEVFASVAGPVHGADSLHFNEAGHARLAEVMVDALLDQALIEGAPTA